MVTLYRIAVRGKETDKRKNSTVHRYVVLASSLDEAKAIACGYWVDKRAAEYRTRTRDHIAAVTGHRMGILAYNADIYGTKDQTERPETVPSAAAIDAAITASEAFEHARDAEDDLTGDD